MTRASFPILVDPPTLAQCQERQKSAAIGMTMLLVMAGQRPLSDHELAELDSMAKVLRVLSTRWRELAAAQLRQAQGLAAKGS